jgi:hypothetical protein
MMASTTVVKDRVDAARTLLLQGASPSSVVSALAEAQGVSVRTARRAVAAAYGSIRDDIAESGIDRQELVGQCIHLLLESARQGLASNNAGAVVGAVAQLDRLLALAPQQTRPGAASYWRP